MVCQKCSAEMATDDHFCRKCGAASTPDVAPGRKTSDGFSPAALVPLAILLVLLTIGFARNFSGSAARSLTVPEALRLTRPVVTHTVVPEPLGGNRVITDTSFETNWGGIVILVLAVGLATATAAVFLRPKRN